MVSCSGASFKYIPYNLFVILNVKQFILCSSSLLIFLTCWQFEMGLDVLQPLLDGRVAAVLGQDGAPLQRGLRLDAAHQCLRAVSVHHTTH